MATSTAFAPSATPAAASTPSCLEETGTWTDFHYDGVVVGGEVPAKVFLPPCYQQGGDRYPVAYFFHGKPYNETEWFDLGLADLVETQSQDGRLPPMILVLARLPEPIFSGTDGGPGSYEVEFIDGLMASVDQEFRTQADRNSRAVVGLSRGGVWALEIGLRHPDLIGAIAALSPALSVNHARPEYDPMRLASEAPSLPTALLLAAGDADWARPATEALAQSLEARNAQPIVLIVAGGHADPTWSALLPDVLGFLATAFAGP